MSPLRKTGGGFRVHRAEPRPYRPVQPDQKKQRAATDQFVDTWHTGHRPQKSATPVGVSGAFTGKAPVTRSRWAGPILQASDLSEARERRMLRGSDSGFLLAPYRGFNPARRPTLLVHGINGASEDLVDLADRLHGEGRQVFFAVYDDMGQTTSDSAKQLAGAMQSLRQSCYARGRNLDIVAHSMGGIVVRGALNTLQQPDWLDGASQDRADPRAGFGKVRVHTVDTPWDGFEGEPESMRHRESMVRGALDFFGALGVFDMRAHSDMFEHLFDPELEGVELRNTSAVQVGKQDDMRAIPDFETHELLAVGRYALDDTEPSTERARNGARSLAQDQRFPRFKRELRSAWSRCHTDEQRASAVGSVYDRVMPRAQGDHTGILHDDPNCDNNLVDYIVRGLTG